MKSILVFIFFLYFSKYSCYPPSLPPSTKRPSCKPSFKPTSNPTIIPTVSPTITPFFLMHRYSFNDIDGSTSAADTAGYNNRNAIVNGLASDIYISGGVLSFQGNSIANAPYLDLTSGIIENQQAFTIEMWVSVTTATIWSRLFHFFTTSNSNANSIGMDNNNYLEAYILNTGYISSTAADGVCLSSTLFASITNNAHVVAVYDVAGSPKVITIYVNGVMTCSATITFSLPSTVYNWIGHSPYTSDPGFSGTFAEIRIWSGPLSSALVLNNYLAGPDILISAAPTFLPSLNPTCKPTYLPTIFVAPSSQPTSLPSCQPTFNPSCQPTSQPSRQPTGQPSVQPTMPTGQPSSQPSSSNPPTVKPSTSKPSISLNPSIKPTLSPTCKPSVNPTFKPSNNPSYLPSRTPTKPTLNPSLKPTVIPTLAPTQIPTSRSPTKPSYQPTSQPSQQPSSQPSSWPTRQPVSTPTVEPTHKPTPKPSFRIKDPSSQPSSQPSTHPSRQPTSRPTGSPTLTHSPTKRPTGQPSTYPTFQSSGSPTSRPSRQPSSNPTCPTSQPTIGPSSQPSSQPSSRPSRQPYSRPTGRPSTQPSREPTSPTGQPSTTPTRQRQIPTVKPTIAANSPSSQPSSQPSCRPSSQPSSFPTLEPTLTYCPTSSPTKDSTRKPTVKPSFGGGIAYTVTPTAFYESVTVSGSIEFEPDAITACSPVQIKIWLAFDKNISYGSLFTMNAPGLTRGFCYNATVGSSLSSLLIPNTANFIVGYTEGSYINNFAGSKLNFKVNNKIGLIPTQQYVIYIDRSNRIRRSCSMERTWDITLTPPTTGSSLAGYKNYNTGEIQGYVSVIETYPKKCFVYYSNIYFTSGHQQFLTGINITLRLGYEIGANTLIKISLPGFTNKIGAYGLNVMIENSNDFIGNGDDKTLYGITSNTNFSWTGYWFQGDYLDNYKDSYIVLTPQGYQGFTDLLWVNIPKSQNQIIPICGQQENSPSFTISSVSDFFYINSTVFGSSNAIGSGCDDLNHCNGNGICDYCTSTCSCFDDFGSEFDKSRTIAHDFAPDCSSRTCPVGPSFGTIVQYDKLIGNQDYHMHKEMECSSNGVCNRKNGHCKCNLGYSGIACEKRTCPGTPSECSGRGKCFSMSRLAKVSTALPLSSVSVEYISTNKTYYKNTWDGDFGHMCVCDSGWEVGLQSGQTQLAEWFGLSCEYRRCPSGDDPMTIHINETNCNGISQTGNKLTRFVGLGEDGNLCHIDCSNRGTCDYNTGLCSCFHGFYGPNCAKFLNS